MSTTLDSYTVLVTAPQLYSPVVVNPRLGPFGPLHTTLAMAGATDMHADLLRLCDESGVEDQVKQFLQARSIRHVATLANLCKTLEEYDPILVDPIIAGTTVGASSFKATAIESVTRATLRTLFEECKATRTRALSTPQAPIPSATTTSTTAASDSDKPPKTLAKQVWQTRIREWESSYTPSRKFPTTLLIGAEPTLARMIWEHDNKNYSLLQLGEIIQQRSFTSVGEINRLATKDMDKCLEVQPDLTLSTRKPKVFEPNSIVAMLDALQAAKWAFVFCGYSSEEEAEKYIAFFEKQTKTHPQTPDRVRDLWNSCYWRMAQDMRMSISFSAATISIMTDLGWVNDQLNKKRDRAPDPSEHRGPAPDRKGKGKGRSPAQQHWRDNTFSKGKGKKGDKGKGKGGKGSKGKSIGKHWR